MNIKQKLLFAILGFVVGNILLLSVIFGLNYFKTSEANAEAISNETAIQLIESEQVKEVTFKSGEFIIEKNDGTRFSSTIDSEPTREMIFSTIKSAKNPITITQEPANNGWTWLILINTVPFVIFFGGFLIIIGLLIGIFVRLNKNKTLN